MEDIFEELAAVGSDEEGVVVEDDRHGSGNRDDEAEEVNETKRVVKPKRIVSRPQPKLDHTRLLGSRGIFTIKSTFDNIKFKGKGHELDDLNNVLSRLQHWAHRLFPKMTFEDCIERIENLGSKREIITNMHKIRYGMVDLDSGQPSQDTGDVDDRVDTPPPDNAFDQLVEKAASPTPPSSLTDEQRARMMRNRVVAEERRLARMQAREKELQERRLTANRAADESCNLPASAPSEETPIEGGTNQYHDTPFSSVTPQSAEVDTCSPMVAENVREAATILSESNCDSTSIALVHEDTMKQSTYHKKGSSDATAVVEQVQLIYSASSSSNANTYVGTGYEQSIVQRMDSADYLDINSAPADEETGVLCSDSYHSKINGSVYLSNEKLILQSSQSTLLDSTTESPAADEGTKAYSGPQSNSLSPKPCPRNSEPDLMEVENLPEPGYDENLVDA